jgi:hypothetical protein
LIKRQWDLQVAEGGTTSYEAISTVTEATSLQADIAEEGGSSHTRTAINVEVQAVKRGTYIL